MLRKGSQQVLSVVKSRNSFMACWLEAAFTFHLDGTFVVPFFFWADSVASAN